MTKKHGKGPNRATKRMILIAVSAAFLFFTGAAARASTIFQDGFEPCSSGPLTGCGWSASNTAAVATTTQFYLGAKSAYFDTLVSGNTYKTGSSLATGTTSFWFRISATAGAVGDSSEITLKQNTNNSSAKIRFSCDGGSCSAWGGLLSYYKAGTGYVKFCEGITMNTWTNAVVEWRASDDKINYYCGQTGVWTGFQTYSEAVFDSLNKISLTATAQTGKLKIYLDSFAESSLPPVLCSDHSDQQECSDAGCWWVYNPFTPANSACIDYEPAANYCEYSESGCLWCSASSTCLAATGCWWNEIKGCSFTENTCASTTLENCENQAECEAATGFWNDDFCFSAPVKTDCSGMSITEGLLCQIKNFLMSAFLPSKEKLNELNLSIGLLNSKFPASYLREVYGFFSNIEAGVNTTSTTLSLKILGHTENVNFGVLTGATTTIGSTIKTLADIIKIIGNLFLLVVFAAWANSFLARIFK